MPIYKRSSRPRPQREVIERPARKLRAGNDNYSAANDNQLDKLLRDAAKAANTLPFGKWFRRFGGPLRAVMTAQQAYEWYSSFGDTMYAPNGWQLYSQCPTPAGGVGGLRASNPVCTPSGTFSPDWYSWPDWSTVPWSTSRVNEAGLITVPVPSPWPYFGYTVREWRRTITSQNLAGNKPHIVLNGNFNPLNPNIVRNLPGEPIQQPPEVSPPRPVPDTWQYATEAAGPPAAHRRQPPRRNQKEAKLRTRTQAIGMAIYQALDGFSEKAELVDSIFDALPDYIKKRWENKHKKRMFVDEFGQYGLEGADWKIQALWYNWDKVDMSTALENIIDNYIEDKVIGFIQKGMPKNVVNAFNQVGEEIVFTEGDQAIVKTTKTSPEEVIVKQIKNLKESLGLSFDYDVWQSFVSRQIRGS